MYLLNIPHMKKNNHNKITDNVSVKPMQNMYSCKTDKFKLDDFFKHAVKKQEEILQESESECEEEESDIENITREQAIEKLLTKNVLSRYAKKLMKKFSLKYRMGKSTINERKLIKEKVTVFMTENSLSIEELQEYTVFNTEFPIKNMVSYILESLKFRTYKFVFQCIGYMYNPFIRCKWNDESDRRLIELVENNGFRWAQHERELEKYRYNARLRYLFLIGRPERQISGYFIRKIAKIGLPRNQKEFEDLSEATGFSCKTLQLKIKQYLKGKLLNKGSDRLKTIEFCLCVLNYNYYCGLSINIKKVMENVTLLDQEANQILATTKKEILSDAEYKEITEKYKNMIDSTIVDNNEDPFFVENITDLSVGIEIADIFWLNIYRHFSTDLCSVKTMFNGLYKEFHWKTFKDVLETVQILGEQHLDRSRTDLTITSHLHNVKLKRNE
ncbi:hypothetical protein NUSPORA_00510 [Nucleospora cyclopteri]